MLVTKTILHTQLTTVQLKLEQPPNGQGMEIGEKEKINQRQPINFHLSHCSSCSTGEKEPFQVSSEMLWVPSSIPVKSSVKKVEKC